VSKEFIEKRVNSSSITLASTQEDQLSYVLISHLQDNKTDAAYYEQWAARKYETNDYFLNWVKQIFKEENFLFFFKYLRFPLASSRIIKNRIDPQIKRVFNAEDADFKYDINGKEYSDFEADLNIKLFNKEIFERLLYKHNSLIVSDLSSDIANKPIRYFLDIHDVVSIEEKNNKIQRIAYTASITFDGVRVNGTMYIDNKEYSFYDKDLERIAYETHDLGHTPVHFISPNKFNNDFIIRESFYTYAREEIEEYNFLKTLQKMSEANGTLPVVTKLGVEYESDDKDGTNGEPNSDNIMSSQRAGVYTEITSTYGDLQPSTIHEIALSDIKDNEGKINMDVVKNFFNFHYTPIEALEYLNRRCKELEVSIISSIVGDFTESNEESKNRDQIEKGIAILENTLTSFGETLNRIRTLSDTDMLGLKYGIKNVNQVFIHYGTDFFLDSQTKLFEDLAKAPNTLERKNIIVRINQNRYKNNADQYSRYKLLYDLIPYVSDKDFDSANTLQMVSDINKDYYLRFNYWVSQFEANFGDIIEYYRNMDGEKNQKLTSINNLMIELINKQIKTN